MESKWTSRVDLGAILVHFLLIFVFRLSETHIFHENLCFASAKPLLFVSSNFNGVREGFEGNASKPSRPPLKLDRVKMRGFRLPQTSPKIQ